MKKLIATVLFALTAATATGCTSKTEYGECVGLQQSDQKNPNLVYKVNTLNVVLGVLFFQMVFPPLIVALADWECPVGQKPPAAK